MIESAVAEGGAYETIRKRLLEQGTQLQQRVAKLDEARLDEFGRSTLEVISRVRVRTENNCVARDIVRVGDYLLLGYNVFLGLKKETKISDVFSLYHLNDQDDQLEVERISTSNTFLEDPQFSSDFYELYTYYKDAKLLQLVSRDSRLFACFQVGDKISDIRVFRWLVSADGKQISYIDNRGERDISLPPKQDFEWIECDRSYFEEGRHPHINILDTLFVDTVGGDLTLKVENNTKTGQGIYSEPVDDRSQSLDDADIAFAQVGKLILLKIKPYGESETRYLIFNTLTQSVKRVDALGQSCVQLPEDHGVIFPGGIYLQTGELRQLGDGINNLHFKRSIKSPNGEDVLYVFYETEEGVVALYPYNMIERDLRNPLIGHGYGLFEDGRLIIFSAENEATRIHPMQIWQTPFQTEEYATANSSTSQNFYGRIGNPDLVRGISELYALVNLIREESVSAEHYSHLMDLIERLFNHFHWLTDAELNGLSELLKSISATADLVLGEYEKVASIRDKSTQALEDAEQQQRQLIRRLQPDSWHRALDFIKALDQLRRQKGHLLTIRELRYINTNKIAELEKELTQAQQDLAKQTVEFLRKEDAFDDYEAEMRSLFERGEQISTRHEITPILEAFDELSSGLDLLSEMVSGLNIDDATVRTDIIERISTVYSQLNQLKAKTKNRSKDLGSAESIAQFSAQFKLFSQSVANNLGMATTPEKCDELLSRLLVQLEELESQFSEHEQFLADILEKREEVFEAFESHKQSLMDERQRRVQQMADSAKRMLQSIQKRSEKMTEQEQMNTFFASDPLVLKTLDMAQQLRDLGDSVKADDLESQIKLVKDQAIRGLRDKKDIFEAGGTVIKLGPRHRFSVNTQELDLTIIPRGDHQTIHLTGTDFYEAIENETLNELRPYWDLTLESESPSVYRGEYLAYSLIKAAEEGSATFSHKTLTASSKSEGELQELIREFMAPRYKEGYEKGIHDHDALLILKVLLPMQQMGGLLRYGPIKRALAVLFWGCESQSDAVKSWSQRAASALQMRELFASSANFLKLKEEIALQLTNFVERQKLTFAAIDVEKAAEYLLQELGKERLHFVQSKYAKRLVESFTQALNVANGWRGFESALASIHGQPGKRWQLAFDWLDAFVSANELGELKRFVPEAAAALSLEEPLNFNATEVDVVASVDDLLGSHQLIKQQSLAIELDEFFDRLDEHQGVTIPGYRQYLQIKSDLAEGKKRELKLHEFKARPLSSFVRNRLINEAYLPLIGDNLAKQMGTVGENKRTDLMGLLMMISPPGYGKTTLMEYVASRLGLIFMKINCPSIGHDVTSLDSDIAPNATARQELIKLNLALEMGQNVMLYLDDIQHTNPEFLQKFISLCDGTRRIEGVWRGQTKTYDMRGKKFCVVMAGNPYTESGEVFKVPDMLANRADIYNLGDVLSGMDEIFALSYIENSLTSNAVLAPLATRDMKDVYRFFDMAKGAEVSSTEFEHTYSSTETKEISDVLKKLFKIQGVVLKVNQQYIKSAATADRYRTEPPFKLQGSYRNMNKMAEKVHAIMTDDELLTIIEDHYQGEAQLLTAGTEENLLKLAELRGNLTTEEQQRWQQIKEEFQLNQSMGGDQGDAQQQAVRQLAKLSGSLDSIGSTLQKVEQQVEQRMAQSEDKVSVEREIWVDKITSSVESLQGVMQKIAQDNKALPKVEVINQPVPGIDQLLKTLAVTIENSIYPLIRTMDGKLDIDLKTHEKMEQVFVQLSLLEKVIKAQNDVK